MLEKDLYANLRDSPLNLNVFYQRIESSTADGIPDVYFNSGCISGWCELKYLDRTKTDKYNLSKKKYTMVQRGWNATHTRNGGITLLCIGIGSKIFWLRGKKAITILRFTMVEIESWAFHEGVDFPIKKLAKLIRD